MRFSKFLIVIFTFLLSCSQAAFGQFEVYPEIGINAGSHFLKSDYGQRGNFKNNIQNSGYIIGISYYLNFAYSTFNSNSFFSHLREHTKIRTDLTFSHTELQHFGKWVDPKRTSLGAQQLRAMRGESNIIGFGVGGEYSFKSIHAFESTDGGFSPFISLGLQVNYYNPKTYSLMGDINNPDNVFPKYINGFTNDAGFTGSIWGGAGIRYKIDVFNDFILEFRGQQYFQDWVDGLNPNPDTFPENKHKDWSAYLTLGYILYLDKNNPMFE